MLALFAIAMMAVMYAGDVKAETGSRSLNEYLSAEASAAVNNQGYFITDIRVEEKEVTVVYQSLEDADLTVAFYEENSNVLATSVTKKVSATENIATMEIKENLPEYYVACAYLTDLEDHAPLCETYTCSLYTKEIQELIASEIGDYDSYRTINFDDNEKTNFAVYDQNTVVVTETEDENHPTQNENGITITDATDDVLNLKSGDMLAVETTEKEIVVLTVDTVNVSGTTVTITENKEASVEDAFECLKFDSEVDQSGMKVDTSTMDDLLEFEGVTKCEDPSQIELSSLDREFEAKYEATYKITKGGLVLDGGDTDKKDFDAGISGTIKFSVSGKVSVYTSRQYTNVSVVVEGAVTPAITFEGKYSHEFELGYINIPTGVPGVFVGLSPRVPIEASGKITFEGSLKMTLGVGYDTDQGLVNKCTWPQLSCELKAEASVSVGLKTKLMVGIVHEKLISVGISPIVSAEATGTLTTKKDDDIKHPCNACIDGDINIKFELEIEASVAFQDYSKKIPELSGKYKVADFYFCIDKMEFGWGECPYITYKTTVQVKDENGNPVNDNYFIKGTGLQSDPVTNQKGIATFYLPKGTYALTVSSGEAAGRADVVIEDKPRTITIQMEKGKNITNHMNLFGDATLMADGSIRLTECETWESGSAWYPEGIDTSKGFSVRFRYKAGGGRDDYYGGADGIAMDFASDMGLGAQGEYLGYVDGYGVELDSYPRNDNDPEGKHFAIIKDDVSNHLVYKEDDRVDDGSWHNIMVKYNADQKSMSIDLDGTWILSASNITMPSVVYMGLTAATGSGKNYHFVDDFFITTGNNNSISVFNLGGIYPSSIENTEDAKIGLASTYYGKEEETEDGIEVKFEGLQPGERYLLADTIDTGAEDLFNEKNLLYIDQGTADENGKLQFVCKPKKDEYSSIRLYGVSRYQEDDEELIRKLKADKHLTDYVSFIWGKDGKSCNVSVSRADAKAAVYPAKVTGKVSVPATCREMGTTLYTAVYEGFSDSREVKDIPKLTHHFSDWVVTQRATALMKGTSSRTCTLCGASESKEVEKLKPTIKLSKKKVTMRKKQTVRIKVKGLAFGDGVQSWKSNKPKTVSVKNGKLKAKKIGKAVITVTLKSGKKAKIKVTVKQAKKKKAKSAKK
ncbi:MAG: hypothetical protein K6E18_05050 [Lachnospiraceae bacterium]|nr:hypothetical protein [Lachnospiraceae bacterium]